MNLSLIGATIFIKAETKNNITYWEHAFAEKNVTLSDSIGYENTLIWCNANYNELYAIPKGMGVNCCLTAYVMNNFSELKSKYIAISSGSELDNMCRDSGFFEIGRTQQVVIYQRY